ncbi:hypothetical protein [Mycobacterium sp.]|jgi:hypothetical protein|uniref:hypothetical protein n=1 Tax=Mycobacterium sp. TaxID=1785 RepID=UPI003C73B8B1
MARTDAYQVTVDHEFYKTYTEDNYVTIGDPLEIIVQKQFGKARSNRAALDLARRLTF